MRMGGGIGTTTVTLPDGDVRCLDGVRDYVAVLSIEHAEEKPRERPWFGASLEDQERLPQGVHLAGDDGWLRTERAPETTGYEWMILGVGISDPTARVTIRPDRTRTQVQTFGGPWCVTGFQLTSPLRLHQQDFRITYQPGERAQCTFTLMGLILMPMRKDW